MSRLRRSLAFAALLALACGDDDAPDDAGGEDAPADAGVDAGEDAGALDAGPLPATWLCEAAPAPAPFPAPDAWKPPGWRSRGPARTFEEAELGEHCAYLSGHPDDIQHHNLVVAYDGYLLMPWAPEWGIFGGITLWDMTDPCQPVEHGVGTSTTMRESHSIGFSHLGGAWAVVDGITSILPRPAGGVEFWDLRDTTAPRPVRSFDLPGFVYPDAYARVTLSVFWQVPYVYAGGADNGVYVIDAADPTDPRLVGQYVFDPILRVGQVQAIGNLLVATAAEGPRAVLLDISDPTDPQPIPGGDFLALDEAGEPREAYFTNLVNGHVWYARKSSGTGLLAYDVRDPRRPTFAGSIRSEGGGGYVFVKDEHAFLGASNRGFVYDVSDLSAMREVMELHLTGDLDTVIPYGNVVVLSVDDAAEEGQGSAVVPFEREPDTRTPRVTWAYPPDGAEGLALTSRFGVGFSEMLEPRSAFEGSVRLTVTATGERVPGVVSAQETLVSFHPFCPLQPGTEYTLEIMAGGVTDFDDNALEETVTLRYRTAAR